jgi:hypothetical protein
MMRQIHRRNLTIGVAALALLSAALLAAQVRADGLAPAIVRDPLTGVALDGIDPVSYFTEPAPQQGLPDFEYDWSGVPWYFANGADRDVFIRAPEVYAPQFGGHATMALAQGFLSDGNPKIYVLAAKRLYLFYSTGNRDAFLAAPAASIKSARANWAQLSKQFAAGPAPAPPLSPPGGATAAKPGVTPTP